MTAIFAVGIIVGIIVIVTIHHVIKEGFPIESGLSRFVAGMLSSTNVSALGFSSILKCSNRRMIKSGFLPVISRWYWLHFRRSASHVRDDQSFWVL